VGLADLQVASSFDGQREAKNATWLQFFWLNFGFKKFGQKTDLLGKSALPIKTFRVICPKVAIDF
jgi:hypothetical protein